MTNAIFDPVFVNKKNTSSKARSESAHTKDFRVLQFAGVPLGIGSCLRRTGHPFTVSGPCGPSQKIECVFSASPETIRREPREFDLRRSVGNRSTWQSARCVILLFFRRGGSRFLGRYAPRICERYEIALPPINGEQISHHLPSYGQRRSIGISFLLFSFIDQGQIMILSGCQLRGFHQHTLDMFVALFGKRGAHHLVGRALFITAEPAVTDGFSDRGETTSPISSAQVSAVIGPTPGTVLRRLIRSASKGSRCRELTRAYSVFCSRTMLSRLTRSRGRILSFTSALLESSSRKYPTLCSRRLLWLNGFRHWNRSAVVARIRSPEHQRRAHVFD